MSDAIFFRKAAGIDQSSFGFGIAERKTEIDARARGGLNLREDMIAIKRDDRLAGTRLRFFANTEAELKQGVVDRPQLCLSAGIHLLHVSFGSGEIFIGIADLSAFAIGALGQP